MESNKYQAKSCKKENFFQVYHLFFLVKFLKNSKPTLALSSFSTSGRKSIFLVCWLRSHFLFSNRNVNLKLIKMMKLLLILSLVSILLHEEIIVFVQWNQYQNPSLFKKLYKFGKGYSKLNIVNFVSLDDIINNICRFFL